MPKTFLKNTILSAATEFSTVFLFVLLILAARFLGDEQYGVFSFAFAFVGLFEVVNDFGMRYLLVRDISRGRSQVEYYLGNVLSLQAGLSLLGLVIVLGLIMSIEVSSEERLAVVILQIASILRVLKFTFKHGFQAFDRFDLAATTLLIERVLLLIVGSIVLSLGYGVVGFSLVFFAVRIIDLSVTIAIFLRWVRVPTFNIDLSVWRYLLINAMPLALNGIFMVFLIRVDTVMLAMMRNDAEVGWYNAGARLIEGLYIIPSIITNSLLPQLSRLYAESKESFLEMLSKGFRYVFLVGIPIMTLLMLGAEPLVFALYGEQYEQATQVIEWLVVGLIFNYVLQTGGAALVAMNKQHVYFKFSGMVLLVNVILNSILIPLWGHLGAAGASAISYCLLCLLILVFLWNMGYWSPFLRLISKPLIAGLTLVFTWKAIESSSIMVAAVSAGCIYIIVLSIMRYWEEEELDLLKKYYTSILSRH